DLRSVYPYCSSRSCASVATISTPLRSSIRRFSNSSSRKGPWRLVIGNTYYILHSINHGQYPLETRDSGLGKHRSRGGRGLRGVDNAGTVRWKDVSLVD